MMPLKTQTWLQLCFGFILMLSISNDTLFSPIRLFTKHSTRCTTATVTFSTTSMQMPKIFLCKELKSVL